MKTEQQIDKEISELKNELKNLTGTRTEVYSRIVGYYRSVKNWNRGKKAEYDKRVAYSALTPPLEEIEIGDAQPALKESSAVSQAPLFSNSVAYYSYFYRNTCPKCPPVKKYIQGLPLEGKHINVDNENGFEQALEFNVTSSPTVIFFDKSGKEVFRAHDIEKLKEQRQVIRS